MKGTDGKAKTERWERDRSSQFQSQTHSKQPLIQFFFFDVINYFWSTHFGKELQIVGRQKVCRQDVCLSNDVLLNAVRVNMFVCKNK